MGPDIDSAIAYWNRLFPFDKKWRSKYNVPFGSSQHLQMKIVDIFFDIREEALYAETATLHKIHKEKEEEVKKGVLFTNRIEESSEIIDSLFDKLNF